jgi:hypothetical protein
MLGEREPKYRNDLILKHKVDSTRAENPLFSPGGVYYDLAKWVTKDPHSEPKSVLSQSSSLLTTSSKTLISIYRI